MFLVRHTAAHVVSAPCSKGQAAAHTLNKQHNTVWGFQLYTTRTHTNKYNACEAGGAAGHLLQQGGVETATA